MTTTHEGAIREAIEALELAGLCMEGNTEAEHQAYCRDAVKAAQSARAKLEALCAAVPEHLDEAMEAQAGGPVAIEAFFQKHELAGGPNHNIWCAAKLLSSAVKK